MHRSTSLDDYLVALCNSQYEGDEANTLTVDWTQCGIRGLIAGIELADYELRGNVWYLEDETESDVNWSRVQELVTLQDDLRALLRRGALTLMQDLDQQRSKAGDDAAHRLITDLLAPLWARPVLPTTALLSWEAGGPRKRTLGPFNPPALPVPTVPANVPLPKWVLSVAEAARPHLSQLLAPEIVSAGIAYAVSAAAAWESGLRAENASDLMLQVPVAFALAEREGALLRVFITMLPRAVDRTAVLKEISDRHDFSDPAALLGQSLENARQALLRQQIKLHEPVWLDVEDWPGGAWMPRRDGYGGRSAGVMLAARLAAHAWGVEMQQGVVASIACTASGELQRVTRVAAKALASGRLGIGRLLVHEENRKDAIDGSGSVIHVEAVEADENIVQVLTSRLLQDPYQKVVERALLSEAARVWSEDPFGPALLLPLLNQLVTASGEGHYVGLVRWESGRPEAALRALHRQLLELRQQDDSMQHRHPMVLRLTPDRWWQVLGNDKLSLVDLSQQELDRLEGSAQWKDRIALVREHLRSGTLVLLFDSLADSGSDPLWVASRETQVRLLERIKTDRVARCVTIARAGSVAGDDQQPLHHFRGGHFLRDSYEWHTVPLEDLKGSSPFSRHQDDVLNNAINQVVALRAELLTGGLNLQGDEGGDVDARKEMVQRHFLEEVRKDAPDAARAKPYHLPRFLCRLHPNEFKPTSDESIEADTFLRKRTGTVVLLAESAKGKTSLLLSEVARWQYDRRMGQPAPDPIYKLLYSEQNNLRGEAGTAAPMPLFPELSEHDDVKNDRELARWLGLQEVCWEGAAVLLDNPEGLEDNVLVVESAGRRFGQFLCDPPSHCLIVLACRLDIWNRQDTTSLVWWIRQELEKKKHVNVTYVGLVDLDERKVLRYLSDIWGCEVVIG